MFILKFELTYCVAGNFGAKINMLIISFCFNCVHTLFKTGMKTNTAIFGYVKAVSLVTLLQFLIVFACLSG